MEAPGQISYRSDFIPLSRTLQKASDGVQQAYIIHGRDLDAVDSPTWDLWPFVEFVSLHCNP